MERNVNMYLDSVFNLFETIVYKSNMPSSFNKVVVCLSSKI